jgi:tRNA U34 5-carboxymethylaminomethyl modifying GTPase MnmE/TrmE
MHDEFELFKGTTFSDLMKDIYHNSKKKDRQINTLIKNLEPLIKNIGDATVIVPLIKEYLDVSVKNDEALVKLAAVVQRLVGSASKDDGGEFGMSEEEKQRLLETAQEELDAIHKQSEELNLGGTK